LFSEKGNAGARIVRSRVRDVASDLVRDVVGDVVGDTVGGVVGGRGAEHVSAVFRQASRPQAAATPAPAAAPAVDLERVRAEAFAQGEAAGRGAVQQEVGALAVRLANALAEASRQTQDELRAVELGLADLALAVAEKILGCEVASGRYDLVAILERALARVRDKGEAVVHLNPHDLAAVEPATAAAGEAVAACRLVADPTIPRGELVVETPGGRIVHSILGEVETVRRAIQEGEGNS
jgi:flagellar biosynthesis/type III secretory pathway protein FliH